MIITNTRTSEPVTSRTQSFEMREPVSQEQRWGDTNLNTIYKIYSVANAKSYGLSPNYVDSLINRTERDIKDNYSVDSQRQLSVELEAARLTYDHPEMKKEIGLGFRLKPDNLSLAA